MLVKPELRDWYDHRAAASGLTLSSYLERVLAVYRMIMEEED